MENKERESRLISLIAKGSHDAFNDFYEMFISFVLHIATQVLGNQDEAEDVTHDIFLDIYQNPKQFDPNRGSVKAWLAVKTRNLCIDRLRKKKPVLIHKLEMLETASEVKTELYVLLQIEKELIIDALKHIPDKQRKVIYGAYFEGKTQMELSESLNKPLGTIKSLVRYGLRNMRKQRDLVNWMKTR